MKRSLFTGILLVIAAVLSSVSYADVTVANGYYNVDPVYAVFTVVPPDPVHAVTAAKVIDRTERPLDTSPSYFASENTHNRIPKSSIACGTSLEFSEVPTKIPITI